MTWRENFLRAALFQGPEWIPCGVDISPMTAVRMRGDLERMVRDHPRIFPEPGAVTLDYDHGMPPAYRAGDLFTDRWGCVWSTMIDGLEGQVVGHPLESWDALDQWRPPDPSRETERGSRDWAEERARMEERRRAGLLTHGSAERLFDRLYFLRGFENLMMDFATGSAQLERLIEILAEYESRLVELWTDVGVDLISFHTDIGTQNGLMISPETFRARIKPMFTTLFQRCRRAGSVVYLSSDGRLLEIVDDLVECGVNIHDPQLRANTLKGISRAYRGKLCARVDLDRQGFPFATPAALRDQVKAVVEELGDPQGGLMVLAAVYGEIPASTLAALCEAMEDFCFP